MQAEKSIVSAICSDHHMDGLTPMESGSNDQQTSAATDAPTDADTEQNDKDPARHGCKSALAPLLWTVLLVFIGICPILCPCKNGSRDR